MSHTCLVSSRWHDTAFTAGGRLYQWLDVFVAAMWRGDWPAFEQRLVGGLACAAAAESDGVHPEHDRVDAEATAFRYARDLLTTEETTRWLERAGLDVEAWTAFHVRDLLRQDRADQIDALIEAHREAIAITDQTFTAEGFCSDAFSAMSQTLAGRAAVAADRAGTGPAPTPADPAEVDRVRLAYAPWLAPLDPGDLLPRLAHVAHLEAVFQDEARTALTDRALQIELERRRMDWMRIDLEQLSFDDEHAAREALLCIREDGLSCHDVAQESHQSVRDTRDVVERLAPEWREVVLSASAGEALGPIDMGHGFEVAVLVAKHPATLDDPLVATRAREAVIERLVGRAVLAHVRWPAGTRPGPMIGTPA